MSDLTDRLRKHSRAFGSRMDLHHVAMDCKRSADALDAKDAENKKLKKLLSMWLEVNDWDEGVGGLRQNTIIALQEPADQSGDTTP